jgi:hypothetical protein
MTVEVEGVIGVGTLAVGTGNAGPPYAEEYAACK